MGISLSSPASNNVTLQAQPSATTLTNHHNSPVSQLDDNLGPSSAVLSDTRAENGAATSTFHVARGIDPSNATNPSQTNDLNGQSPAMVDTAATGIASNFSLPIDNRNATTNDDFKLNLFGNVVYPSKWLTLPTLYSLLGPLSSLAMIVGCVLPYVPQYITIYKLDSCKGFSTFVCLTLLVANILRVAFWFGHRFELPLLVQSVVMIIAQLLLLELCVRVNTCPLKRSIFKIRYFWRWDSLLNYLGFLSFFTLILGVSMYFLIDCKLFVESIGYCALVTESMLGLPQVIKNYRNKSVKGMSLSMVLMWLGGDTFKTGYFIANQVPFQFWLCGLVQITIDLLILIQVCLFRQKPFKKPSFSIDLI